MPSSLQFLFPYSWIFFVIAAGFVLLWLGFLLLLFYFVLLFGRLFLSLRPLSLTRIICFTMGLELSFRILWTPVDTQLKTMSESPQESISSLQFSGVREGPSRSSPIHDWLLAGQSCVDPLQTAIAARTAVFATSFLITPKEQPCCGEEGGDLCCGRT